ncbi:MAG TPA: VOC family protein [Pseudolysinimonas sp.]|nr:VOC family protein [Pseudolysinimonas sp.]
MSTNAAPGIPESVAKSADILAADTAMGAVTLRVGNLDAMTAYYRDVIGLDQLDATGSRVTLGRPGRPAMILEHTPELAHAGPRDAGLFHTAILFDSKEALAAAVYAVARSGAGRFSGSSDHLVSNAFYFDDPEGNGVELYWDRERTDWSWAHGQIEMHTLFLDPNRFLAENLSERGEAGAGFGDARVGHVHLSVGDIPRAREFYITQLGFEQTIEIAGQALFVSAGGYHHHMAMNTWNARGAGRRQQTLGLGRVDIIVPGADDLGALTERMQHAGIQPRNDGRSLAFDDPWDNLVTVTPADTVPA